MEREKDREEEPCLKLHILCLPVIRFVSVECKYNCGIVVACVCVCLCVCVCVCVCVFFCGGGLWLWCGVFLCVCVCVFWCVWWLCVCVCVFLCVCVFSDKPGHLNPPVSHLSRQR